MANAGTMNVFIQILLQTILPVIEGAIASEGQAAFTWLENEINSILQKYGYTATITPTTPVVTPPKTS